MAQIVFNIDNGKIERVKDAMAGLFPIPMIPDPEHPGEQIPQFTKTQWAKECVRLWIVKQVARYEQKKAQDAIVYNPDDSLIQ